MFTPLPRASTLLRLPRKKALGTICLRKVHSTKLNLLAYSPASQKQLSSPPDITNCSRLDLNEFVGSPGWTLDELLPPNRQQPPQSTSHKETITPETLNHLLSLSGLPQPKSPAEESTLLNALHDQLHFVRHVQSVPTDGVEPLVRVGDERGTGEVNSDGALTFEECVEESQLEMIPGLEWKQWDVCGLKGGSPEARAEGWFSVRDEYPTTSEEESLTEEVDQPIGMQ